MGYILYVDTESDIVTKKCYSVQTLHDDIYEQFSTFDDKSYARIYDLWNHADAVMMYNAPYDMGVLSSIFYGRNKYEWTERVDTNFWTMIIFGGAYTVKRINGFRNNIKNGVVSTDIRGGTYDSKKRRPKAPPVIDLLKLWSILVDDGSVHSISLKALIHDVLHREAIHYDDATAHTDIYQRQDVECLRDLWGVFLERVASISDTKGYNYQDWANICTPATLCKHAYKSAYPSMAKYQEHNDLTDKKFGLIRPLADAYHGGITCALYRGDLQDIAWYDIHGAYAHVIEYENTDQYLCYNWSEIGPETTEIQRDNMPILCRVSTNCMFASIAKSMKIYKLEIPTITWMWSYDILALRLLFPDARIIISKMYRLVPLIHTTKSLPAHWSALKEAEQRAHGKTTLREYYKLMSNTSYGIKAQRKPYRTQHTNLAIAGIITARAHLILCEMIDEACKHNCKWRYSDTDSIAVSMCNYDAKTLEDEINARVSPYSVECEACKSDLKILSLKRYVSTHRKDIDGHKMSNKICLHGKSIYKVETNDILRAINEKYTSHKALHLTSISANTARTYNRVKKLNPFCHDYIHPFAFETDCMADISFDEWYSAWYAHIDTKLTYPENSLKDAQFERNFRVFHDNTQANIFYGSMMSSEAEKTVYNPCARNYDDEDEYFYDSSSSESSDAPE